MNNKNVVNMDAKNDGSNFNVLPEGEYGFTVTKFERQFHKGNFEIPSCHKAVIYMDIYNDKGETVKTGLAVDLFLHEKYEGVLVAFFRAIGDYRPGERFVMDWANVPGATGRCFIRQKQLESNETSGEMLYGNKVEFSKPYNKKDNSIKKAA